nr:MAG TPA: hypothetical protein [Caudoviricetes sp.]
MLYKKAHLITVGYVIFLILTNSRQPVCRRSLALIVFVVALPLL